MDISKIKAVIFDCDGVLFDTAAANKKYYNEILVYFGRPEMNQEQFVNVHMMSVVNAIAYLFPDMDDLSPVFDYLKTVGYHKFIPYMRMEDDLVWLLTRIKESGFIRGIATNRTNTMERVLEEFKIKEYFEIVITAAHVQHPKPSPDQLNLIMNLLKLPAHQILFIGDSEYDLQAARTAGTRFVGFKNPALAADVNVSSMKELAGILKINE